MYIIGDSADRVFEYNLSTAWNIATAVLFQSFSIAPQTILPTGLFFRSDGLKMYISSQTFPSLIYEYNLSTAWNISTTSFLQSFTITAQDNTPTGLFIRDDGLKMFVTGGGNDRIYEYNLTTPWNVTTAVFVQSFLTNVANVFTDGVFFRSDGQKMYHVDGSLHNAYEYNLPFTPPTVQTKTTKIRARLVSASEPINDPTGWIKVGNNVATKILIDDPLYPDLIRLNLDGGAGINPRYAYKDTGKVISGDVKFEFKLDYDAMGQIGFPATISGGSSASTP